jgi:hypothetical protein
MRCVCLYRLPGSGNREILVMLLCGADVLETMKTPGKSTMPLRAPRVAADLLVFGRRALALGGCRGIRKTPSRPLLLRRFTVRHGRGLSLVPRAQRILGYGVACIRRAGSDTEAIVRDNPILAKVLHATLSPRTRHSEERAAHRKMGRDSEGGWVWVRGVEKKG